MKQYSTNDLLSQERCREKARMIKGSVSSQKGTQGEEPIHTQKIRTLASSNSRFNVTHLLTPIYANIHRIQR